MATVVVIIMGEVLAFVRIIDTNPLRVGLHGIRR